ncbi:MAG: WecB/TagA/CpsF family glycosyltransferase [Acidobacteriia bacterium]|nr:WecB/TagA/CpsF family glycosyltransferase [Terriglobia bacterium]
MESAHILGMRVDATSYHDAVSRIVAWARLRDSRYVSIATVNNVVEAYDSRDFARIMREADLVTSDGMPLVWAMRLLGIPGASRVYGPDLTPLILGAAEREGLPAAFYGGTPDALARLLAVVQGRFPRLKIAYAFSPPFRPLTPQENQQTARDINASGAAIVLVGLSTPKQERWMAAQKGLLHAPMVGVGAAFDFLAGMKPQAPRWMMRIGMEWLFRLVTEPGRLWKRYLKQNPRFIVLFALQLLRLKHSLRQAATSR